MCCQGGSKISSTETEETEASPQAVPGDAADLDGQAAAAADSEQLQEMLDALGGIGRAPRGGVTRLAYSETERAAHELVARWWRACGASVWVDGAGNTIGELPGAGPGGPAIGMGSHLDSVVGGGRFDGAAGVVAATEVLRLLAKGPRLARRFRCVAFAGEEGARFGQACLGSGMVAGRIGRLDLEQLRDRDGTSLAAAMRAVGLDPAAAVSARWGADEWCAFVELHIEQGSVLEREGARIGLVDLVSGSTRLEIELWGRASHSGGTPMAGRADALAAAAELVLEAEALATDARHRGTRITVGRLEVEPGELTTIPGYARLLVDIRDIDSDRQRHTAQMILQHAKGICDRRGTTCAGRLLGDASPVVLPAWLRDIFADAFGDLGESYRVVNSGASHDAQVVNRVVPACIVFVPSRAGLSHVPEEWTSAEDLAHGTDLCVAAIRELDRRLEAWAPGDVSRSTSRP